MPGVDDVQTGVNDLVTGIDDVDCDGWLSLPNTQAKDAMLNWLWSAGVENDEEGGSDGQSAGGEDARDDQKGGIYHQLGGHDVEDSCSYKHWSREGRFSS